MNEKILKDIIDVIQTERTKASKEVKALIKWMIERLPLNNPKGDYAKVVSDLFNNYLKRLAELQEEDIAYIFPNGSKEYYMEILNGYCDSIKQIIRLYSEGRGYAAFEKFKDLMSDEKGLWGCLRRKVDWGKHNLYRLRKLAPSSSVTKEEMFHIPLNCRGKVASQRYSAPGYPCLYLGYSINACWEELGRPALNSFMVVSVAQQHDIKIIDLSIPSGIDDFKWQEDVWKFIMSYPFIVACSVKVSDTNNTYKEEYIIPQMLTNYVIEQNTLNRDEIIFFEEITAIKYTSTHYNKQFGWDRKYFTNLAIPVINISSPTKYCPDLCELYHLSTPTCVEYEQISGNLTQEMRYTPFDKYFSSLWGRLEQTLSNRPVEKINNK